ncbi:peptide chain release factor N(5)-glutamine methyltransferase [Terrarubrum flagellatum]|uniref:peptide chain release factor N(5)-glutamine methyltransferase n=1 Tax=Terrirubrum flagellatum TaxID=2895980 RepID=UPI00314502ED
MTRAELLAAARRRLTEADIDKPALDARVLTLHALGLDALDLVRSPEAPVDEGMIAQVDAAIARRIAGEPVARILGWKEFFGLRFKLSPDTLSPRPETELIVEEALRIFPDRDAPLSVVDLGTGTGCILLSILHERKQATGIGIDRAFGAASTARENARALDLAGRACFTVGDWSAALRGGFDLLVANPPYIRSQEIAGLAREVTEHDPALALDGGADGLAPYRAILDDLPRLLRPGGAALFEIGHDQAADVSALVRRRGLPGPSVLRDLAGRDRVVAITI